jgi:hypothetical protein
MGSGTNFIKTSYAEKQNDNLPCFQSGEVEISHGNILLIKKELPNFNKYIFTA